MESEHRPSLDAGELSESLTALGQVVVSEQSLQESLQRVAELSRRATYGSDGAGVTWVVAGRPTTVTAAGDFVRRIDEIQYALDEGPCLEAYRSQQLVLVENLETDPRWPRFTPAALSHGLRGVIAAPLTAHATRLGALNVYTKHARVFDDSSLATTQLFAEQASVVLANADAFARAQSVAHNLGEALNSRAVIDMAKGIVMAQRDCDAVAAFDHLRQLSQSQQRKLRDIAHDLVQQFAPGRSDGPSSDP